MSFALGRVEAPFVSSTTCSRAIPSRTALATAIAAGTHAEQARFSSTH